jgi:enediyne biosynthesis protein CalE2
VAWQRLRSGPPIVLDGGLGDELERRGLTAPGPLWATDGLARGGVADIHRAHRDAGAEVLTTATFRLQPARVEEARRMDGRSSTSLDGAALAARAVALARAQQPLAVAGSMGPVADCYRPDLVPPDAVLRRQHEASAHWLADAGADVLLVETMNTIREARVAVHAAAAPGTPVWAAVVCGEDARLLSGEPVPAWAHAMASLPRPPEVLLINCTPIAATDAAVAALQRAWDGPWGAYPNRAGGTLAELDAACTRWVKQGAAVLGTCCGYAPEATRNVAFSVACATRTATPRPRREPRAPGA